MFSKRFLMTFEGTPRGKRWQRDKWQITRGATDFQPSLFFGEMVTKL